MTKNTAASVRARLSKKAKESGRPFQALLQYYGLERLDIGFRARNTLPIRRGRGVLRRRVGA